MMVHVTDSNEDPEQKPGQRHRFRATGGPSKPTRRPASAAAASTGSSRAVPGSAAEADAAVSAESALSGRSKATTVTVDADGAVDGKPSDADVVRTTGSMAFATLLSRITGFLRTVLISSALGGAIASAFNTANVLPNLITELVLGAVLTSLVIPLLVRAEKEDSDRGEAFIRRLVTLTFTLMMTVTVVAVFAAPLLTRMSLGGDSKVNVGMSTAFAYLVLPQIVFYAMFAVLMAVLNTKGYFKPGAWAPVVNNVVTIGVLSLYWLLPQDSKLSPNDSVTITDPHIMLLGLGTTFGVVVQALIMVPYLKKAGVNLRPLWGLDDRLRQFGGMALAIVVYVAISQVGFILNNRIAAGSDDTAPTIYTQAWQLLQMPYGIIGVTLLTAFMPRLSRNAADGDDKAVVKDLTTASRLTMLAMVPVIIYLTAFGTVIGPALFAYGSFSPDAANVLGWTVSFSAFTLIPYSLVLLHLRVFYAREEVWTPTFIIGGITVTKLVLAYLAPHIASEPRLVVVLLGAANGMGFVTGAIIGHRLLKRSLGHLGMRSVAKTALWALGASVIAALIAWRVDALLTAFVVSDSSSIGYIVRLLITGVVFLILAGIMLSFSKLPEVLTIGAALARLPLVGRFFRKAAVAAAQLEENAPATGSTTRITDMSFGDNSGMGTGLVGALPPLSAGRVRGPRLVPGAPILQGRFRLLADHGGSPTARLWQARDNADGDLVALTVIDTLKSGRSASEIVAASARLADATATSPAVALVREICNAGSVVVIVSDWTQGSPLTRAAESGPDPLAAGYAMADLADAAGAGCSLGIDHRNRLRISTEGRAVLAFPGLVPTDAGTDAGPGDVHAIGVSLDLLLAGVPGAPESVPAELTSIVDAARSGGITDGHELARQLRSATRPSDDPHTGPHLAATADVTPEVTDRAGFGAAPENRGRLAAIGVATVAGVIAVVAVIVIALAFFGGDRKDSPVTTDSILGGPGLGTIGVQQPTEAVEWSPVDGRGTPDNPEDAPLAIDGNPDTAWASAQYQVQFGPTDSSVKEGIGLLLTLPQATALTEVQLTGVNPGMTVELRTGSGDITSLDQTTLLATGISEGDTLSLAPDGDGVTADGEQGTKDLPDPEDRVLLWITGLPMPDAAQVAEITVHGAPKVTKEDGAAEGTGAPSAGETVPAE
jgi:putative peptidoglycan lipid II flippase